MSPDGYVGVSEIAALAGVQRNSAWRWTRRADFPAPTDRLASGPIWKRKDVERWLVEHRPKPGRPPGKGSGTGKSGI